MFYTIVQSLNSKLSAPTFQSMHPFTFRRQFGICICKVQRQLSQSKVCIEFSIAVVFNYKSSLALIIYYNSFVIYVISSDLKNKHLSKFHNRKFQIKFHHNTKKVELAKF